MLLENPNAGGVYAEAVLEEPQHMNLDSLKVLEGRVEDVLSRQAALCAERDRLQGALDEAQRRVAELQRQVETFERERTQVRARVESILGRLEGLDLS